MDTQQIFEELKSHFPDAGLELVETKHPAVPRQVEPAGEPFIYVSADFIETICQALQLREIFRFDCLSNLTAVDWADRQEVVYHLFSYHHRHKVSLHVKLPRENPHIKTVEQVWRVANWFEREVFDLFGIVFDGHSDLRRILLPDDWIGHPLRKDYQEEATYHGIETTRESLLK